jgi:hypothetical protein
MAVTTRSGRHQVPVAVLLKAKSLSAFSLKPQSDRLLVATSKVPCMSIMNMPPLPYVKRIPGLNYDALKPAYTDPAVWDNFEPGLLTLCSPDPEAIRPPDEKVNVLQVTLPTNFKVAKFDNDKYTAILHKLQADIEAVRSRRKARSSCR